MSNIAIVIPMYGRSYTSEDAAITDWDNDKDFRLENAIDKWCGKPCNKSDLLKYSKYTCVKIYLDKSLQTYALVDLK